MSWSEVEEETALSDEVRRVVSCDLTFAVAEAGEVALQVVAADSAGRVVTERFDVTTDGAPPASLEEIRNPQHERIHVVHSASGRLSVSYRAEIETRPQRAAPATGNGARTPSGFERQLYMRPSRYCPSDHLVGFAVAEFRLDTDVTSRVASITEWIRRRICYVPGSSDVHDSAEHTLLTGMGTCRDFAHLGIALCRATGIPGPVRGCLRARALPHGLHAVFETLQRGRWTVNDATGLAPRASMVRIATGRDAADAAFSAVNSGVIDMEFLEVSATVGSVLPWENPAEIVELA